MSWSSNPPPVEQDPPEPVDPLVEATDEIARLTALVAEQEANRMEIHKRLQEVEAILQRRYADYPEIGPFLIRVHRTVQGALEISAKRVSP